MEYLTNLVAHKKYLRIMNAKVVFKKEELDAIIVNIDEAIRKTILKGECKVTVFGTGYIGVNSDNAWTDKYNRNEVHSLLDYLDYHYHKQGFRASVSKDSTVFYSQIEIKLKKVKEKDLH